MALEPITRREMFMAKVAGQNVNVPEPITREEKYLAAIVDSGGGGGGDRRFVVNVTRDEDWKPSFDKTYEEIMEACIAGKEVVVRDGSFVYTLTGYDDDEGYCAFFLPGNQLGNSIGFSVMRIKRDGRWEECGGTVNCTIEWSDTNEPSQPPV